nr:hypothetical protein [Nostoc sp. EkiNYC01]
PEPRLTSSFGKSVPFNSSYYSSSLPRPPRFPRLHFRLDRPFVTWPSTVIDMATSHRMSSLPDLEMKDLSHDITFYHHRQASDPIEQPHSAGSATLTPTLLEQESRSYASHIRSALGNPAPVFVDVVLLLRISTDRF